MLPASPQCAPRRPHMRQCAAHGGAPRLPARPAQLPGQGTAAGTAGTADGGEGSAVLQAGPELVVFVAIVAVAQLSGSDPTLCLPKPYVLPQVADFGLSRVVDQAAVLTSSCGTVGAMPLELLEQALLTKAADVYSFGVLCWEVRVGGACGSAGCVGLARLQATARPFASVHLLSAADVQLLPGLGWAHACSDSVRTHHPGAAPGGPRGRPTRVQGAAGAAAALAPADMGGETSTVPGAPPVVLHRLAHAPL